MHIRTTVFAVTGCWPAGQWAASTTVEQLLIQHPPVKAVPFTAQYPVSGGGETVQVRVAELCSMPPLPEAVAVTLIGPPAATQVAIPVFGSRVATLWSDEDHCATTFACVVGAESNVPVALKGTVPPDTASASPGCTDKAINCRG